MKPLQPIYRFAIGVLLILFIIAGLAIFVDRKSNPITPEQLAIQLTVDSVNQRWYARNIAYQDSLQLVYSDSARTLKAAATTYANRARRLERIASEQQAELEDLRNAAPAECKEVVDAYVEALDTCNAKATTWHNAYTTEVLAHGQTLLQVTSLKENAATMQLSVKGLKKTVSDQRDYITGVTNRSDRNWLFRNWRWMCGNWREYVLQKE